MLRKVVLPAALGVGLLGMAFGGLSLGGCSTVVMTEPKAAPGVASAEREDLAAAAAAVAETHWPRADAGGLGGMLGLGGGRITEEDSVRAYLASLGDGPGRGVAVLKDAYVHVDAAYALARAADDAAARVDPTDDDVRLVEDAIGALRGARNVYLASLRTLDKSGDGVEDRTRNALKGAFDSAIREIGAAADALSDRLARRRLDAARAAAPIAAREPAAGAL